MITTISSGEGTLLRPLSRTLNEGSCRWILLKIGMCTNFDAWTTKIEDPEQANDYKPYLQPSTLVKGDVNNMKTNTCTQYEHKHTYLHNLACTFSYVPQFEVHEVHNIKWRYIRRPLFRTRKGPEMFELTEVKKIFG